MHRMRWTLMTVDSAGTSSRPPPLFFSWSSMVKVFCIAVVASPCACLYHQFPITTALFLGPWTQRLLSFCHPVGVSLSVP